MKKLMIGIAGIMAMVASVNAADTDKIKVACQASDKTLWVERNKVCIPKNPCKDEKFEAYCNRIYKDFSIRGVYLNEEGRYKALVEAYAAGHNLSCNALSAENHLVGQDYVICNGYDVMVFEFDDIGDENVFNDSQDLDEAYRRAICGAIGGVFRLGTDVCEGISRNLCERLENIVEYYGLKWDVWWANQFENCNIEVGRF